MVMMNHEKEELFQMEEMNSSENSNSLTRAVNHLLTQVNLHIDKRAFQ